MQGIDNPEFAWQSNPNNTNINGQTGSDNGMLGQQTAPLSYRGNNGFPNDGSWVMGAGNTPRYIPQGSHSFEGNRPANQFAGDTSLPYDGQYGQYPTARGTPIGFPYSSQGLPFGRQFPFAGRNIKGRYGQLPKAKSFPEMNGGYRPDSLHYGQRYQSEWNRFDPRGRRSNDGNRGLGSGQDRSTSPGFDNQMLDRTMGLGQGSVNGYPRGGRNWPGTDHRWNGGTPNNFGERNMYSNDDDAKARYMTRGLFPSNYYYGKDRPFDTQGQTGHTLNNRGGIIDPRQSGGSLSGEPFRGDHGLPTGSDLGQKSKHPGGNIDQQYPSLSGSNGPISNGQTPNPNGIGTFNTPNSANPYERIGPVSLNHGGRDHRLGDTEDSQMLERGNRMRPSGSFQPRDFSPIDPNSVDSKRRGGVPPVQYGPQSYPRDSVDPNSLDSKRRGNALSDQYGPPDYRRQHVNQNSFDSKGRRSEQPDQYGQPSYYQGPIDPNSFDSNLPDQYGQPSYHQGPIDPNSLDSKRRGTAIPGQYDPVGPSYGASDDFNGNPWGGMAETGRPDMDGVTVYPLPGSPFSLRCQCKRFCDRNEQDRGSCKTCQGSVCPRKCCQHG